MKTNRDKWLACLLPALLTAIIYIFGPGKTEQQAFSTAQTQLAKAEEVPTPNTGAKQSALLDANNRLAAERKRAGELKSAAVKLPGIDVAHPASRSDVLRTLSDLLAAKHLKLTNSTLLQKDAAKLLPKQTDALAKRLSEQGAAPHAEFYELEIDGEYPKMLEAIQEIDRSGQFIVPVSIEMEPQKNGGLHWRLTVWI
jgi:hypothetical protein